MGAQPTRHCPMFSTGNRVARRYDGVPGTDPYGKVDDGS